jgi:hypothetical protein
MKTARRIASAAERTNDPVLHKLLLALASKWKQLAAQEEAKSKEISTLDEKSKLQP